MNIEMSNKSLKNILILAFFIFLLCVAYHYLGSVWISKIIVR